LTIKPPAVIDIHSHFFPPITQAEAASLDPHAAPWLQVNDNEHGMIMTGNKPFRPVYSALWDTLAASSKWMPPASMCKSCAPRR